MNEFPYLLIGMQLVKWDDDKKILTVKKEDQLLDLVFDDSDEGDCCGYNEFFANLLVSDDDLSLNPVITNVEVLHNSDADDWQESKITFFGEAKKLLCIESESGSGSGWCYGACVTVKCDALGLSELVTSW